MHRSIYSCHYHIFDLPTSYRSNHLIELNIQSVSCRSPHLGPAKAEKILDPCFLGGNLMKSVCFSHTGIPTKKCGMFFLTVEGDFRSIEVELAKVASGCWIKPFKAHLKCRHVFSRFKSVFGVPTQGEFCLIQNAAETPTPHIHESLSGPIWCPGSKHKWQTCPKLCHPKKGMTIEIPVVVFLLCVCCLAMSSLENEAHQAFLH